MNMDPYFSNSSSILNTKKIRVNSVIWISTAKYRKIVSNFFAQNTWFEFSRRNIEKAFKILENKGSSRNFRAKISKKIWKILDKVPKFECSRHNQKFWNTPQFDYVCKTRTFLLPLKCGMDVLYYCKIF